MIRPEVHLRHSDMVPIRSLPRPTSWALPFAWARVSLPSEYRDRGLPAPEPAAVPEFDAPNDAGLARKVDHAAARPLPERYARSGGPIGAIPEDDPDVIHLEITILYLNADRVEESFTRTNFYDVLFYGQAHLAAAQQLPLLSGSGGRAECYWQGGKRENDGQGTAQVSDHRELLNERFQLGLQ
jgi:hypothetical protein